jgi:F-type H+-transporting ATPase subunit delta
MAESKVAGRYAKSLFGDLALLLKNPIINASKKDSILSSIFKGKITDLSLAFLQIITRKKRESYIEEIAKEYVSQYKESKGIKIAKIITASPLDDKLRSEVMDYLTKKTNKKIELAEEINKDIIGGYILRWGDEQIDASISKKLRTLHQEFDSNVYLKDYV